MPGGWVAQHITKSEFISIIVPVYNVELYLSDCLESLVNQTSENFEVVLVNDGTEDDSMSIVERYKTLLPRLKVIEQENGGLSAARNTGLEVATGEYVLFLDSDDSLRIDAVEVILSRFKELDCEVICYSAETFGDSKFLSCGRVGHSYSREGESIKSMVTGVDFLLESLRTNKYIPSSCLFSFKRSLIGDLRFIEGVLHEDNHFTPAIIVRATSVSSINEGIYLRRYREGSITTSQASKRTVDSFISIANELIKLARKRSSREGDVLYFFSVKCLMASLSHSITVGGLSLLKETSKKVDKLTIDVPRSYNNWKLIFSVKLPVFYYLWFFVVKKSAMR